MMWMVILLAAGVMLVLALFMTFVLGWANDTMKVAVDPRVEKINDALPGANCGGCGYIGCNDYAEALVQDGAAVDLCPVGGSSVAEKVAEILGVSLEESYPYRPAVHCVAGYDDKLGRNEYRGEKTCIGANLVSGVQGCAYGCLSLGDCINACTFDAILLVEGKIEIDYEKCVGCGACEKVCPRKVISMVPFKTEQMYVVACSNKDFGKDVKAVCKVGCIGCKACTRVAEGLFQAKDNLSLIDYDQYDPSEVEEMIGVVLKKCPAKSIVKIGKPSAEDLQAVKDEKMPDIVKAKFETTVDKTKWRG
ncbi:MAG TPA: RnfABCDGE type electron transport complex subunit B [Phycisphaerae bacterium]|nr:RnfABCDGE type electron transport complex subunit B [Phycisphaerae bacterium]